MCSPDGSTITFTKNELERTGGRTLQVDIMDSNGGNVRRITRNLGSKFVPRWSPDGISITFVIEEVGPRANIFKVGVDGNNLRRLTVGPKMDGKPAFSPDGSKLAFESNRSGNYEIYVMELR